MSRGRLIYGGSFNPIHIGHLRLAIEAFEIMGALVEGVDFVPAAMPPHKDSRGILPFAFRAKLVKAALDGIKDMRCEGLEAERAGPSYTWDTLANLEKKHPGATLYFLLGSEDYKLLPEWRHGLELTARCDLVVARRGEFRNSDFLARTFDFWPEAASDPTALEALRHCGKECACAALPNGHKVYFLPIPWLDVSATRLRELWLAGRDVEYLAPDAVLAMLEQNRRMVGDCWREND